MLVLKIRCLKIYSSIILWMKLPPFQILFSRRETNKTKLIIVLMLVAHFCSSQMLQRKCISISVCMLIFTDMLEVKNHNSNKLILLILKYSHCKIMANYKYGCHSSRWYCDVLPIKIKNKTNIFIKKRSIMSQNKTKNQYVMNSNPAGAFIIFIFRNIFKT